MNRTTFECVEDSVKSYVSLAHGYRKEDVQLGTIENALISATVVSMNRLEDQIEEILSMLSKK